MARAVHFGGFFGYRDCELPRFQSSNCVPPSLRPDVRITPQHGRTHVSHDIKHRALWNARLSEFRAE